MQYDYDNMHQLQWRLVRDELWYYNNFTSAPQICNTNDIIHLPLSALLLPAFFLLLHAIHKPEFHWSHQRWHSDNISTHTGFHNVTLTV